MMRPNSPTSRGNLTRAEVVQEKRRAAKERARQLKLEEERSRLKSRLELARMLREYPVCAMADPAIVSHDDMPYIDFIDLGLRENRNDVQPKEKVTTEEGMMGKMLKLNSIDLHKYYHTVAWTKRLHRNPIKKSEAYTNPNEKHQSILTQIMTKVKATPMQLKETDIDDTYYSMRKTKNEQDKLSDIDSEESLDISDDNQSWLDEIEDQDELIERAIDNLQKKKAFNRKQNVKDSKNIKVARRFQTRMETAIDEQGKKLPKRRPIKALHVRGATPAETNKIVVDAYETKVPRWIQENKYK